VTEIPTISLALDELEEIAYQHGGQIEYDTAAGTAHLIHDGHEYVAEVRS